MTDYTQVTSFTPKDSLLTGDTNKKILGSQLDGELSLIATAIASKLSISTISGLANPTASIGLSAVNGSAITAIRSDGSPALSQAIAPTWTGIHTFTKTGSTTQIVLQTSDAGADLKNVVIRSGSSGGLQIVSSSDAAPTGGLTSLISSTRTGTAWPTLILGNAVDNTVVSCPGIGGFTVAGALGSADGVVSAPGLAFSGDPDTGFYRIGANSLGVAAGGVLAASFNGGSSGNVVIGNSANTNSIGFNTSTSLTIGAAGGAAALPATPAGYITVTISGTAAKIPFYTP